MADNMVDSFFTFTDGMAANELRDTIPMLTGLLQSRANPHNLRGAAETMRNMAESLEHFANVKETDARV